MNIELKILVIALFSVSLALLFPGEPPAEPNHPAKVKAQEVVAKPAALPPTATVTAPSPVPPIGCESYRSAVSQYDWDVRTAMAVMKAENHHCNPSIDNAGLNKDGTVDYGLFQVNSVHADMVNGNLESLRTPAINIATAYRVWSASRSFNPWTTYKDGSYRDYLL